MTLTDHILIRFSLFLIISVLSGILFGVLGLFTYFISYVLPILFVCFIVVTFYKIFILREEILFSKLHIFVIIGIFIFSLINIFFYHEIVDGARDDGVYTLNAVYLSTHGTIFNNNRDLYFTGFTKIKPDLFVLEFIPGYTTYLAIFYSIGGFPLLFLSNSLLIFLSLFWIYKTGRLLKGSKAGIIAVIFFATHYTTFWFSRRTNSENLLLFLFWFSAFLLLSYVKTKKLSFLFYGILPLLLIFLTRPEGIMYIASYVLAFLIGVTILRIRKQPLFIKENVFEPICLLLITLSIFLTSLFLITKQGLNYWSSGFSSFITILFGTSGRFLDIIKSKFIGFLNESAIKENISSSVDSISKPVIWNDFTSFSIPYVINVLIKYFIFPPFLLSLLLIKKIVNLNTFVLLFFAAPTFLYLINPQIAPDHPWMMRRYFPIFIPLVYILFTKAILSFNNKKLQLTLIILTLGINIALSYPIITFTEGRGSLQGLEKLNNKLQNADFVFFNGRSSQWASSLYFLFDKKTMTGYTDKNNFLPPLRKYDTIYVVSTSKYNLHPLIPDSSLEYVESYSLTIPYLKRAFVEITQQKMFESGLINSLLTTIPPQTVVSQTSDFNVYKLISKDFMKNLNQ